MRTIAIGAMVLPLLVLGTTPAMAGLNEQITSEGGSVGFLHSGERLIAHDERRDGYGVGAYLTWNDDFGGHVRRAVDGRSSGGLGVQAVLVWRDATDHSRTEFVVDATGADNLSKVNDRTPVTLTLCYVSDQGPTDCSRPQRAVA